MSKGKQMNESKSKFHSRFHGFLLAGAAVAALFPTGRVMAAEGAQSAAANNDRIEEIVVTARKQAENLQQIPLAVTAFSAKTLDEVHPFNITELNNLAASLNAQPASQRSGTTQGRIQMRGTAGAVVALPVMMLKLANMPGFSSLSGFATLARTESRCVFGSIEGATQEIFASNTRLGKAKTCTSTGSRDPCTARRRGASDSR